MDNFLSRRLVGQPGPQSCGDGGDPASSEGGGGDVSSPVLPCEKGPPEKPPVRIRVSLFYDGTGNNRINVGLGSGFKKQDSYKNGLSNIARLETEGLEGKGPGMDVHLTVYTEGIGTTDFGSDSTLDAALGKGKTGVPAKVKRGIANAISDIRGHPDVKDKIIEELHLDTFGFSRGAAAARYCIWKCMQDDNTTLKKQLEAYRFTVGEVSVKFVGLYDTVASYGLKHKNDTEQLHLDAISSAEKVVQLAAAEEHRVNFRLTNIKSAGDKGREIFLPGAHSDVGGGYADSDDEEEWELFDLDAAWLNAQGKAALAREREWLVASGWYRRNELAETNFWKTIKATRCKIKNTYSFIPLHLMAKFARENGVPIASSVETKHVIPEELNVAKKEIETYVGRGGTSLPGDWFKTNPALDPPWHIALRHDYLHFSSRYNGLIGAHAPQWSEEGPVKGHRERKIQDG